LLLDLTFFGLTQEYRLSLFKIIHEIVFNGQGGYDWNTVYNMPIWLRRFTFETLREHYEKQKEEIDKQQNTLTNKGKGDISRPNIAPKQPTYTAKAPKK
jgi:hypothetical protein